MKITPVILSEVINRSFNMRDITIVSKVPVSNAAVPYPMLGNAAQGYQPRLDVVEISTTQKRPIQENKVLFEFEVDGDRKFVEYQINTINNFNKYGRGPEEYAAIQNIVKEVCDIEGIDYSKLAAINTHKVYHEYDNDQFNERLVDDLFTDLGGRDFVVGAEGTSDMAECFELVKPTAEVVTEESISRSIVEDKRVAKHAGLPELINSEVINRLFNMNDITIVSKVPVSNAAVPYTMLGNAAQGYQTGLDVVEITTTQKRSIQENKVLFEFEGGTSDMAECFELVKPTAEVAMAPLVENTISIELIADDNEKLLFEIPVTIMNDIEGIKNHISENYYEKLLSKRIQTINQIDVSQYSKLRLINFIANYIASNRSAGTKALLI